jgi:hypothetical protein
MTTSSGNAYGGSLGGNTLVLQGTSFYGVNNMTFGATPVTSFSIDSSSQITLTTPAGPANTTVDISLANPEGTTMLGLVDKFTYVTKPSIGYITVSGQYARFDTSSGNAYGAYYGGNTLVLHGSSFYGTQQILFQNNPCTSFTIDNSSQITLLTPSGQANTTTNIRLTNIVAQSDISLINQFTYITSPAISSLTLSYGKIQMTTSSGNAYGGSLGGNTLVLRGTSFYGVNNMTFGAIPVTSFSIDSSSQITVVTPDGPANTTVDISLANPEGTTIQGVVDKFTYVTKPSIGYITVSGQYARFDTSSGNAYGAYYGGNTLVLHGNSFYGTQQIFFQNTPCTTFTIDNSSQITLLTPSGSANTTTNIRLTNIVAQSDIQVADQFTYITTPVLSSITLSYGMVNMTTSSGNAYGGSLGGNTLILHGNSFYGIKRIAFGPNAATSFSIDSNSQMTLTTPAGQANTTVDISLANPEGNSQLGLADQFTFITTPQLSALTVSGQYANFTTSIGNAYGTAQGGNTLILTGTSLYGTQQILFNNTASTSFHIDSSSQITLTTPAGPANTTVDIQLTNIVGSSTQNHPINQFHYITVPAISYLTVSGQYAHFDTSSGNAYGASYGGNTLLITGNSFFGISKVQFGNVLATQVQYDTSRQTMLVVTPPGIANTTVDIVITNPDGSSQVSLVDQYTYITLPVISAITLSYGVVQFSTSSGNAYGGSLGGNTIILTGTSFYGTKKVKFGTIDVSAFSIDSSSQITLTTPAGPANTMVDISLSNPEGNNQHQTANQFTFITNPAIAFLTVSGQYAHFDTSSGNAYGTYMGGNTLVLTGTSFYGTQNIQFGTQNIQFGTQNIQFGTAQPAYSSFTIIDNSHIILTTPPGTANTTVDIQVTNLMGQSTLNRPINQYNYITTPAISAITVSGTFAHFTTSSGNAYGAYYGGNTLVITGNSFFGISQVLFGSIAASTISVDSSSQMTLTTPAGQADATVDILITNPDGPSVANITDQYTYISNPNITGIQLSLNSPVLTDGTAYGRYKGGDTIYLRGNSFYGLKKVKIGGIDVSSFTIDSNNLIKVVIPSGFANTTVDISLSNPEGASVPNVASKLTYITNPNIISIRPSKAYSGNVLSITGTSFYGTTLIKFTSTKYANLPSYTSSQFTVDSSSHITIPSILFNSIPKKQQVTLNVTLLNIVGNSISNSLFNFDTTGVITTQTGLITYKKVNNLLNGI